MIDLNCVSELIKLRRVSTSWIALRAGYLRSDSNGSGQATSGPGLDRKMYCAWFQAIPNT